jgi:hypothetical protein
MLEAQIGTQRVLELEERIKEILRFVYVAAREKI